MPRVAKELSAIEVKRLKHPGRGRNACFMVGGVAGLMLQITPNGGRTWLLRVAVGDRRREIGLGGYPEVPLAQARERAREAKDAIRRGIDPVEERKAARAALMTAQRRGLSFADAADRFLDAKLPEFRNPKHAAQWRTTLTTYALPDLGHMLVNDITVQDVLRALQPIWQDKTETAKRVRGRIELVLSWATVAGHRQGDNPARWKGNLDALLAKPSKVAKSENWPALALNDAAPWFAALRRRDGIAARALEFLCLTASRSGAVRRATWAEFDLEAGLWTVPALHMKMKREHRVPLPREALALLRGLLRMEGNPLVFPAPRGGVLSDMSLSAVMRRMQEAEEKAGRPGWLDPRSRRPAVPHGLRSTFRDWAADLTHYPREVSEIALAHDVGSEVERAYRRSDMMEKRRDLMAAWAGFLSEQHPMDD